MCERSVCVGIYFIFILLLLARTVKHTLMAGFLNSLGFADKFLAHTLFVNKRPLCGYNGEQRRWVGSKEATKTQVRLASLE